ncbi:hypothetical protein SAMD00019534_118480, partial [Acytostelium subglobosum LB1]|uniref:hypothetical protein n=1 Tax=Acytostelium subglobosum LB1 TaxID=1410327 RepID=UPI0006448ABA
MDERSQHHASLYSEESIKSDLLEWEAKYSSTDRTAKMLAQLQETHSTGVDTLMKLGEQGEQMDRVERLTNEQEQHVKGLGKYKKFHKYMKKLSKKDKYKEEKPKAKEIHHELNVVEARHHANDVIMKKREQDRLLEMEQKKALYNTPNLEKTDDRQGISSKLWRKSSDIKQQAEQSMERSKPIEQQNEEDLRDNVYIKNANWIKVEDEHLDQMNLILADMKNVAIATHTEVQRQSIKLDDIDQSMDRGNHFELRRKSSRQVEREKKKGIKEEEKRIDDANRKKAIVDAKVEKEIGHKPLYKSKYLGRHEKESGNTSVNPFL